MPHFGHLGEFSEANRAAWGEYCERLEQYFLANKIEDADVQRAVFLSSVGEATYGTLRSLCSPRKPKDIVLQELLETLQNHYDPKPSSIVARFRFNSCRKSGTESVRDYVARLRMLSGNCQYGAMLNEMIRDRLVCGVDDEAIQSRLLAEADLTLDKAVNLAVALETAACNTHELKQFSAPLLTTEQPPAVSWVGQSETPRPRNRVKHYSDRPKQFSKCFRCLSDRHSNVNCPFKLRRCFECNKVGHTRAAHKAGTVSVVEGSGTTAVAEPSHDAGTDGETDEVYSLFNVTQAGAGSEFHPPLLLAVKLQGRDTHMEVDTGASCSVMGETLFRELCGQHFPLGVSDRVFRTYTGEKIKVLGVADVDVACQGKVTRKLPLVIVRGHGKGLIGRNWLKETKMNWTALLCGETLQITEKGEDYSNVFNEELGCFIGGKAHLFIDKDVRPRFFKARPIPLSLQDKVDKELTRLENEGVIESVKFSEWAAPLVVVPKPSGDVRLCGDFKLTVNKAAALEQYPLPRVEELFASLSGCCVFSKLDMSHAYNQIELDKESQKYVVVNTPRGLKRYKRLAFGIHSAVAIFQKILSTLLAGLPQVTVFLDDVVVGGKNQEEHDTLLKEVLRRMCHAGLRLNKKKCQLRLSQVTYLGHNISERGIEPTDEKTKAILDAPPPEDKKSLRAWLGLLNYYSKFLDNIATILSPLYLLLRDRQPWVWGKEQEEAFLKAKEVILSPPCLAHFNVKLDTVLACDASPYGVGCVLSQVDEKGLERPVAFYSRTLHEAERRYSQTDREGLSIVTGVKKFHYYLYGRPFTIKTDHKPLLGLFGEEKLIPSVASPRVLRWALLMAAYKYKLLYSPARLHSHCDALSRLPLAAMPRTVPIPAEMLHMMELMASGPVSQVQVREWTHRDPVLSSVLRFVRDGWPRDLSGYPPDIATYKNRECELSVQDGCLFWGSRIVIPPQGRDDVLKELHEGHFGASKMKSRARAYFWWPGLDHAVESMVGNCRVCQEQRPKDPPSDLRPWGWPQRPWSRLHLDYCGPVEGQLWLLLVDAHSLALTA
ncbi:uncharacterized protein K02A2.6-like [Portunus trituberculatus]|uniref:uncharacterized protein K02A2.6-like n=1 Tax=Portunus trituberculatus TaxID=210409 RepID=UPI001E1CD814|nr:uncharacterized protein K02A2.6-like [Portunus trituberculatus]XP_045118883.1 uncharacterized protein K02A2.6-like [Portunus trituberculatus]XP_045124044.1 uncharacterized protein K02A2.6-like isoform X2 [Portunus trituberculatus]XP_045126246.1 uncharacterized protein K02A2.6-like isoform X2 [Portunus trituberculatus]XP_045126527.1 uncharacterized protein K02A2.6-like [Portunus trituberculatus]XP_045135069.1 uncharacterized protein K02A2.6-like [Portunus trituberculatus]